VGRLFRDSSEPPWDPRGTFIDKVLKIVRAPDQATRSSAGPSDAALVLAARAGEAWAQEALFRRHAPMVNGLAFRLMGRDADVDDLVQDAFVIAFGRLHSLDDPQAFGGWLGSIVVRTAGKVIRRRVLLERLGLRRRREPVDIDTVATRIAGPDVGAELQKIYKRLDELPAEQRIAFLLRRVEGMELEEIARATGASLATTKRRIAAAQQAVERWVDRERP
jgi:RNA polymerase sigma-70 factor (ECF subfamily)